MTTTSPEAGIFPDAEWAHRADQKFGLLTGHVDDLARWHRGLELDIHEIKETAVRIENALQKYEKMLHSHDKGLAHCNEMITINGRQLDEHTKRLGGIEHRLDGHDKRLGRIEHRLDGHDKRFDRVDETLAGHGELLRSHGDMLRGHGDMLRLILARLDDRN